MSNVLAHPLAVRVSGKTKKEFIAKAVKFGGQSTVLREMIDAFLENRLSIEPRPVKEILK